MTTFRKTIRTSIVAALLLAGITTGVHGQVSGGGLLHIKGSVVCRGCSLDEARKAQPSQDQLYQLTHEQGQIVMNVHSVNNSPTWRYFGWPAEINNSPTWRYFGWPAEIQVRAQDGLFEKLAAEENLFKDVEITGLLSTTRALDIFEVTISG